MDEKNLELQKLQRKLEEVVSLLEIEVKELKEQNSLLKKEYEMLLVSFKDNEQLRG